MTPTSGEGAEKMDAEDGVNCSDYEHDIENEDLWDGNEDSLVSSTRCNSI